MKTLRFNFTDAFLFRDDAKKAELEEAERVIVKAVGYEPERHIIDGIKVLVFKSSICSVSVPVTWGVTKLEISDNGAVINCYEGKDHGELTQKATPAPYIEEVEFQAWVSDDGHISFDKSVLLEHPTEKNCLGFSNYKVDIKKGFTYTFRARGTEMLSMNLTQR